MSVFSRLLAVSVAAFSFHLWAAQTGPVDLDGKPADPFAAHDRVNVLLFVRTDCPITNRYAPELRRIADEFQARGVQFWLIYPDPDQAAAGIKDQVRDFKFPGTPLRDPHHDLVHEAHATVAPEAAVFDATGKLVYHGRIDDRWVDIGKQRPAAQVHDLEDAIAATLAGKPVTHPATQAVGCSLADVE